MKTCVEATVEMFQNTHVPELDDTVGTVTIHL